MLSYSAHVIQTWWSTQVILDTSLHNAITAIVIVNSGVTGWALGVLGWTLAGTGATVNLSFAVDKISGGSGVLVGLSDFHWVGVATLTFGLNWFDWCWTILVLNNVSDALSVTTAAEWGILWWVEGDQLWMASWAADWRW